ncbi:hypothetical protein QKU58_gp093 [Pyramimonas orientalis virus]|uniref:DUF1643 domain-containing protein n=1 Tax=Pyramimonas orientalis virus 01B TaxID=3134525 RepID=A0A7M3UNI1_9VIRU|nr:hypothetical protein QKU58_gp093 [Pyramimonas orientalis virus]QOI90238.1 hypothetical protein HWQ62_00101 [Pyramimonas orientalis virus]
MQKSAVISLDNLYRYQLSRIWDTTKPYIMFVMLNPSTADADVDDPTIRRVVNFCIAWGYGGVYVTNLYAFRSTDPKRLKDIVDPCGPENIQNIQNLINLVDKVVYAWGNTKKEPEWLKKIVNIPYCIDVSKKNIPKHPLYLRKNLELQIFSR